MRLPFKGPILLLLFSAAAMAKPPKPGDPLPRCTLVLREGSYCSILAQDLKPTQFAVGFRIWNEKRKKLASLSQSELQKLLFKKPVPLIGGPQGRMYAIDHHHLARALLAVRPQEPMLGYLQKNWGGAGWPSFWNAMKQARLVWLFDEAGRGPLSPDQLPQTMAALSDDPYRSLADVAGDRGCFKKVPVPFLEFYWAQFLRPRVRIGAGEAGFEAAVQAALPLCRLPEAPHFPDR